MKIKRLAILAIILILVIFISLFLNYNYKEGLDVKVNGEYQPLTGQHGLCNNPQNKKVCDKNEGCGKGYVNLGLEKPGDLNSYRCTNPEGPFQYLAKCPDGQYLSTNSRGCVKIK